MPIFSADTLDFLITGIFLDEGGCTLFYFPFSKMSYVCPTIKRCNSYTLALEVLKYKQDTWPDFLGLPKSEFFSKLNNVWYTYIIVFVLQIVCCHS